MTGIGLGASAQKLLVPVPVKAAPVVAAPVDVFNVAMDSLPVS